MSSMLEVSGLHAYYGNSHVLHGVELEVGENEVVSLLGRNGVGRSTTVKAVMGTVNTAGSIRFKDREILGMAPHDIARLGIGAVPESRDIFPTLTVYENLLIGIKNMKHQGRWTIDDALDLFPNLRRRARTKAGVLSGGEKQMLTICRTLMGDPDLIMVDEPTEGLAPQVVEQVGDFLEHIASLGVSILLVEQKLNIAMRISHRMLVMGHGQIVFSGSVDELRANDEVRKQWLEV